MNDQHSIESYFFKPNWATQPYPFQHIYSPNVFSNSFYSKLCRDYNIRIKELNNSIRKETLLAIDITSQPTDSLSFFTNRKWIDFVSGLLGISATTYINMALHCHPVGSKSGWIHNDLNPGWFQQANNEQISFVTDECDYRNGVSSSVQIRSVQLVRSLAIIFYLNNPDFHHMQGGGTGLFTKNNQDIQNPDVIVPPINNSILIFPCTPFSFHTFLSNKNYQRHSIIMWLHSPIETAIEKWGVNSIVPW